MQNAAAVKNDEITGTAPTTTQDPVPGVSQSEETNELYHDKVFAREVLSEILDTVCCQYEKQRPENIGNIKDDIRELASSSDDSYRSLLCNKCIELIDHFTMMIEEYGIEGFRERETKRINKYTA